MIQWRKWGLLIEFIISFTKNYSQQIEEEKVSVSVMYSETEVTRPRPHQSMKNPYMFSKWSLAWGTKTETTGLVSWLALFTIIAMFCISRKRDIHVGLNHRRTGPVSLRGGVGGGLRSLTWIFSPSVARKSSGDARLLLAFCQKMAVWKTLGGLQPPPPPPPPAS